jgi:hypothetical protein
LSTLEFRSQNYNAVEIEAAMSQIEKITLSEVLKQALLTAAASISPPLTIANTDLYVDLWEKHSNQTAGNTPANPTKVGLVTTAASTSQFGLSGMWLLYFASEDSVTKGSLQVASPVNGIDEIFDIFALNSITYCCASPTPAPTPAPTPDPNVFKLVKDSSASIKNTCCKSDSGGIPLNADADTFPVITGCKDACAQFDGSYQSGAYCLAFNYRIQSNNCTIYFDEVVGIPNAPPDEDDCRCSQRPALIPTPVPTPLPTPTPDWITIDRDYCCANTNVGATYTRFFKPCRTGCEEDEQCMGFEHIQNANGAGNAGTCKYFYEPVTESGPAGMTEPPFGNRGCNCQSYRLHTQRPTPVPTPAPVPIPAPTPTPTPNALEFTAAFDFDALSLLEQLTFVGFVEKFILDVAIFDNLPLVAEEIGDILVSTADNKQVVTFQTLWSVDVDALNDAFKKYAITNNANVAFSTTISSSNGDITVPVSVALFNGFQADQCTDIGRKNQCEPAGCIWNKDHTPRCTATIVTPAPTPVPTPTPTTLPFVAEGDCNSVDLDDAADSFKDSLINNGVAKEDILDVTAECGSILFRVVFRTSAAADTAETAVQAGAVTVRSNGDAVVVAV